jgi:hypothetical protein
MEFWRLMSFTKSFIFTLVLISKIIAQDCKSELIIKSDFNLVNIFINDSLVSDNGNFVGELPKGTYVIIADEVSDRWNSKTFVDTLLINDCNKKEFLFFFRSDTGNSELDKNNNLYHLQKKYYLSDFAYEELDLNIPNPIKKEKFIDSNLFRILTGTAIILGGVTAYYKIKADKLFDEYLSSRNKEKLDQTKKYDLISGITLTAFQINFGYILLRFLME